jgi:general secretion pathway protein G
MKCILNVECGRNTKVRRRALGASGRRGFTLVEVLLVLVILMTMALLTVLAIGPMQRRANVNSAKAEIGLLKTPIATYQLDIGSLPTTLDALRQRPTDLANPQKWGGPYIESDVPADPWGHAYNYICPGTHNPDSYDLWSLGPQDGTEAEIGNW